MLATTRDDHVSSDRFLVSERSSLAHKVAIIHTRDLAVVERLTSLLSVTIEDEKVARSSFLGHGRSIFFSIQITSEEMVAFEFSSGLGLENV